MKTISDTNLEGLLDKALEGRRMSPENLKTLLSLTDKAQVEALFAAARRLRAQHFGDVVFLYGFLYISTYCRNDCNFCYFRRSNRDCRRYRKSGDEILAAADGLAASGVHLIDLTMGEDPRLYSRGEDGFSELIQLVRRVRRQTGLPVMVSPGVVVPSVLTPLASAGADWYACYQETHQRPLFAALRPGQSFDERLEIKRRAHAAGLLIEEGLLSGVGETVDDVADSLRMMEDLAADQVRIMNFVPQPGTPMATAAATDSRREWVTIAVMRLFMPDRLIPATLDVDGIEGLKGRLDAGANVVTSLVPPGRGLAGVAQSELDIEDGNRTAAKVCAVLAGCGLRPATPAAYQAWIQRRRRLVRSLLDRNGFSTRVAVAEDIGGIA